MNVQDMLDAAADYIEQYGWRQGWRGIYGEPACILKAIQLTSPGDYMAAYEAVQVRIGMPWTALGSWNDQRGRTRGEVLALLRGTA